MKGKTQDIQNAIDFFRQEKKILLFWAAKKEWIKISMKFHIKKKKIDFESSYSTSFD